MKHPIFLLYQLELSYAERYGSDSIIVLYIILKNTFGWVDFFLQITILLADCMYISCNWNSLY